MPRASSLRIFIPLIVLASGCGSSDPGGPTPSPAPSPQSAPASLNLRLLAHMTVNERTGMAGTGSGNWGYTSPNGRRFALTGTSVGLSVVEVTDPEHPRNAGVVQGPANQWREVKTYRGYAYVTTEARVGMDIVDL